MSLLNYGALAQELGEESLDWAGFGQPLNLNFSFITGDEELSPDSSVLEGAARFMDALFELQSTVNQARLASQPALQPIEIITKTVGAEGVNPVITWSLTIGINAMASLDNVIDPTAEPEP